MTLKVRRVVTGHDAAGKAIIASDSEIEAWYPILSPDQPLVKLWGSDETPHFPDDGSEPTYKNWFPSVGQFRWMVLEVGPDSGMQTGKVDAETLAKGQAEMEEKIPGVLDYFKATANPDNPDLHGTDSIDFTIILEGELWLEVDNGVEVHLKKGDTVVQNGTVHAWHNHGTVPCRFATVMIGAYHDVIKAPNS